MGLNCNNRALTLPQVQSSAQPICAKASEKTGTRLAQRGAWLLARPIFYSIFFFIEFYWAINKQTQTLLLIAIKIINKSLTGARGNRRALEEPIHWRQEEFGAGQRPISNAEIQKNKFLCLFQSKARNNASTRLLI